MLLKTMHSIPFLFFEKLLPFEGLLHFITTRRGGSSSRQFSSLNLGLNTEDQHSNIVKNYKKIAKIFNFNLAFLMTIQQVHDRNVLLIRKDCKKNRPGRFIFPEPFRGFDAMITAVHGLVIMVRIADCVPVVFFDPSAEIVAVAHAGWRGTLLGVVSKTVKQMVSHYGSIPERIIVGIGPSIGPCCYCVQKDIAELFSVYQTCVQKKKNKLFLNLWEANRLQLIEQGIPHQNIELASLCTSCHTDLFFSHRREKGKTGRFGAFVGLRV